MVLEPYEKFCGVVGKIGRTSIIIFFDNVREVTFTILIFTTQEPDESINDFIKRRWHLAASGNENLMATSFAEILRHFN